MTDPSISSLDDYRYIDEPEDSVEKAYLRVHKLANQTRSFKPMNLSANKIANVLPPDARNSLVAAAKSGDSRVLESTISRIKAKYPRYFRLGQ